jgi:molecular chaperone GrpE (heat shock protein)
MFDVIIKILAILDDMNEEIDRMSKNQGSRTTGIARRIHMVRKELKKTMGSTDG